MATFTLTLSTGNDAFTGDPAPEIARILTEAAERATFESVYPGRVYRLQDANGNRVGFYVLQDGPV
jgi:hypothetical protein